MGSYVLDFQEIDQTKLMLVGGKGLHLGELSRIEGIRVPEGFCVTTEAFQRTLRHHERFQSLLNRLSMQNTENREQIYEISNDIRRVIEETAVPQDIEEEIIRHLSDIGKEHAYAIRSSATAEDLPHASFAGQQDTYLNITGREAILEHIRQCWASLFTDRAVIYRMQNGFDHRKVYLSVVVQRMVFPQISGILFTADPVTSNRKVLSIDASFGLGEALVSGMVSADNYKVREGTIVEKTVAPKKVAIEPLQAGGTEKREIEPDRQNEQTLTDGQILQLERMGRKIESYFECPQDIEWCLVDDTLFIVQSRPITTLYPIPEGNDGRNRVYMSFGHQQMMTDVILPLGMSFLRMISNDFPIHQAGGRLFIDISHDLASPIARKMALAMTGKNDPLMTNALRNLIQQKIFIKSLPRGKRVFTLTREGMSPWSMLLQSLKIYRENNPAVIQQIISQNDASLEELEDQIQAVSGDDLLAFIQADHQRFTKILYDPRGMGVVMVGMYAANWINRKMEKWLGEKNAADTLSQSVPNNVTSEMGLALLDVADAVRPYPEVWAYLEKEAEDETLFADLGRLEGGEAVSEALKAYLDKYGMRCPGEIDITKPRWSEQPTALIPMILSNIQNFEPGASRAKFEEGRRNAEEKERELLGRLKQLPGGSRKAKKTERMIRRLRHFIGFREYPKYLWIRRYFLYKQALMREASKLVQEGVLRKKEDTYYLSFEELREVIRTCRVDHRIIDERKEAYATHKKLTPPRLITSEGELLFGEYDNADLPEGALPGNPVSSGVIEGRARVVHKMEEADIEEGDILVTNSTDPSWTPLFVSIKGLVTEVGGLMTHGSVIAREYGLPAVVGVENATNRIKDGQRIRVNGTEGYVELL
ncbi:phosphoenolpyruvate synthase [Paludifilum halophilum]|uniref:Rifampicin phosphotransferase n=1 Tax=Paludifilum halophilum TaxID=1642702 RepID=A0A235BCE2_9BACL|nr:phosphoenolpyruvate synthase [Paludifilum halophilum]OYD09961.1 phosphoenolpyruvate synthase [Paludifilum halophilum]